MKKQFNKLAGILICITFAVFLLYIKDNMQYIGAGIGAFFSILTPFIYAFGIAYILNFPYRFFHTKVFGRIKAKWFQKINKPLSMTVTYLLVLGGIAGLIAVLIPQVIENITNLINNAPNYIKSFTTYTDDGLAWAHEKFNLDVSYFDNFNSEITRRASEIATMDNLNKVLSALSATLIKVYNWVMALVLSIYMLASKERLCKQLKRFSAAFLPTKWLPTIYEIINVTDEKCGKFLIGKIIDSAIVGALTFVCMLIFGIPYAPLISVIIAVCNIIPFFGPFIGGIPSAFLLLLVSPWDCLIFVIIIFVIQQIDGNLINPHIVGSKVGLIGFWSLFSVMVAGAMFGVPGMILGTPIFAAIYTLLGRKTKKRIIMKGENAERVINAQVIKNRNLTNVTVSHVISGENNTGDVENDSPKGKE